MKISKDKLKQIITEEMSIAFSDGDIEGEKPSEPHDSDGSMAKRNLWKMSEYAKELYNLIDDNEDLEPWVEEKIAIASFMIDSVAHYMEYEKNVDNADASMSSSSIRHEEDEEDEESEDEEEFYFDPEDESSEDEEL